MKIKNEKMKEREDAIDEGMKTGAKRRCSRIVEWKVEDEQAEIQSGGTQYAEFGGLGLWAIEKTCPSIFVVIVRWAKSRVPYAQGQGRRTELEWFSDRGKELRPYSGVRQEERKVQHRVGAGQDGFYRLPSRSTTKSLGY